MEGTWYCSVGTETGVETSFSVTFILVLLKVRISTADLKRCHLGIGLSFFTKVAYRKRLCCCNSLENTYRRQRTFLKLRRDAFDRLVMVESSAPRSGRLG